VNAAANDPAPTAMGLRAQETAYYENAALEQSAARNVVEDRRPAYRQPVPDRRTYMQVPWR
jgi:hypothetical protein